MNESLLSSRGCILKVLGKHGLVFKARHEDQRYLQNLGEELIADEESVYTTYEIHVSDHVNEEMTEPEHLLHIDVSEMQYNY